MVKEKTGRLSRDAWLKAALSLCEAGIDNLKVAPLAEHLGVTTGSFYWHFKSRRELLEGLLDYWEREMTDTALDAAKDFTGPPVERILFLMETVMSDKLARYDLPIWQWAQADTRANRVFKRVLKKRFEFAAWMFSQSGISPLAPQIVNGPVEPTANTGHSGQKKTAPEGAAIDTVLKQFTLSCAWRFRSVPADRSRVTKRQQESEQE